MSIHKPIDTPIEQRNTGKGNPNAILQYGRPLNERQKALLNLLPVYDSRAIICKKDANLRDLAALTAETGDEFAVFTKGGERLVIRGDSAHVNITETIARELAKDGYRWSGHTHPTAYKNDLGASPGDYAILECFQQKSSVILNAKGQFLTFSKE